MSALKKILLFLFTFIAIFSLLFILRFFFFNANLKQDFGYENSFLKKDTFSTLIKGEGETITFSAPIEKISELKLDLVGESLKVIKDNSLKEIKVEVYYPESSFGEISTKIDYKFLTNGDALIFSTDKKTWKKKKANQESLLVGFIVVSLPEDIPSLSISNLFGETKVEGDYSLLSFISFNGSFLFEGSAQRLTLESFKGNLTLKNLSNNGVFQNLFIRTIYSHIQGEGAVDKMSLMSVSSVVEWNGFIRDLSLCSIFLDMNLDLNRVEKGQWNIFSFIGESKVNLPNNSKRSSRYNLFVREDQINSDLDINVKSLGMALNYFY